MNWLRSFLARRREAKDTPVDIQRAIHNVLSTLDGQLVVEWLVESILIAPSYVSGPTSGRCCDTAYHEGQRALVKLLIDERDNYNKEQPETVETKVAA